MNQKTRLETVLAGEKPDRTPVALWQHFPVDDQTPGGLAEAVLHFQRTYDFDLVKVTAESGYFCKDWGLEDEWRGNAEGTRKATRFVVEKPEDWETLPELDPSKGTLADNVKTMEILAGALGRDMPLLPTIFSPLGVARKLAGQDALLAHLRQHPGAVHAGLKTITRSAVRYLEALQAAPLAGVFYAIQLGTFSLLSAEEFSAFGRAYDLEVLGALHESWWLNLLHLHGRDVMFDAVLDYPVQVINWHDLETPPSLAEALTRFDGVVCGGLRQWDTMVLGTPDQVRSEAAAAIQATEGLRFILGTGCVTPITAPHGNLLAARRAVEG